MSVFPNAKFIHLIRDGRDVAESVYRQWLAPPDWKYSLKKAMTFPLVDAFGYAVNYALSLGKKLLFQSSKIQPIWGVHYQGIEQDLLTKDLIEVCALQWVYSVQSASTALLTLSSKQVMTIRYETFVNSPLDSLQQIAEFLSINPSPYPEYIDLNQVSVASIGKGLNQLSTQQIDLMMPYLEDTLKSFQYL